MEKDQQLLGRGPGRPVPTPPWRPGVPEDAATGWGATGRWETGGGVLTEASVGHPNPSESMPPALHSAAKHPGPRAPWAGPRSPGPIFSLAKIEKQA